MNAITLHDKFSEDVIGTVLLKDNVNFPQLADAWDQYQINHNSNGGTEPDIHDFVSKGNWDMCEVLVIDFYQPS